MHLQKGLRQQRNIFFVRPQRRQVNGHDAEPVEQILAELPRANLRLQLAVRRADHPHIHSDRLRPAEPFDRAIFQHAQHFGLRHWIHVANFIEENRAARGQFEFPFFLLRCASKRTALETK